MAKLKIGLKDKELGKIMDILEKANIKIESMSASGITIDASNPAHNDVLKEVMEIAEDYTLS